MLLQRKAEEPAPDHYDAARGYGVKTGPGCVGPANIGTAPKLLPCDDPNEEERRRRLKAEWPGPGEHDVRGAEAMMALRGKTVGGTFPRARARGGGAATADDDARAAEGGKTPGPGDYELQAAFDAVQPRITPSGLIAARDAARDDGFADGDDPATRSPGPGAYPLPSTLGGKGGKMAWFGSTLASADMVRHNLGEMVHTPAPGAYSIRASEEQMALRGKTIGETFSKVETRARAERGESALLPPAAS